MCLSLCAYLNMVCFSSFFRTMASHFHPGLVQRVKDDTVIISSLTTLYCTDDLSV